MAKMMVAIRISHGTSRMKVDCGVISSVHPPRMPPTIPVMSNGITVDRARLAELAAIGADARDLSGPKRHGVAGVGIHRRNAHEQQRWKRHEAAATGYRVDGTREQRGEEENCGVADVHSS